MKLTISDGTVVESADLIQRAAHQLDHSALYYLDLEDMGDENIFTGEDGKFYSVEFKAELVEREDVVVCAKCHRANDSLVSEDCIGCGEPLPEEDDDD